MDDPAFRDEMLGRFGLRKPPRLAVRMWAAYFLASDLFDGTAGPVPAWAVGASNRFAREADAFFHHAALQCRTPDEYAQAKDEGRELADMIQRAGWERAGLEPERRG